GVERRGAAEVGGVGDLKWGGAGCRGGGGLGRAAQGEDARDERGTYRQRSDGTLLSSMRERPQGAAVSESGGAGGYRRRGRGLGRAAARHLLSSLNCGLSTWLSILGLWPPRQTDGA